MGASMWVPVCIFVRTSTVLFPSRWCVVMSVTWIASNCGQVGIRSPQGWVRSTSLVISVREVLHAAELVGHLLRDRQIEDVSSLHVLRDLAELLLARDRAVDVGLRHALVLRPGLGLHQEVEGVRDDILGFLRLVDTELDDAIAVRRVVHR